MYRDRVGGYYSNGVFESGGRLDWNGVSSVGVRPVITLSSDVQIKSDATHDGTSAAKAFILQ